MNKFIIYTLLIFLSGCASSSNRITPQYIDKSKDNKSIVIGHYYLVINGSKSQPDIDWMKGDIIAMDRCKEMGYKFAKRIPVNGVFEHTFCQSYHSDITLPQNTCAEKLIATKYICTMM
ncbi:hypothetical protein ACIMS1_004489 [Vibrio harveyi]